MNRNNRWLLRLAILIAVVVAIASHPLPQPFAPSALLAQSSPTSSPAASPSPRSSVPPLLPNRLPNAAPRSAPSPSLAIPSNLPSPPAPPASTAPPLPLASDYRDPAGRFKVGVLKDYKVTPLAGSVLIEAVDGHLAYSVISQLQPTNNAIGLSFDGNGENLARIATAVFQRGEGFQPGSPRLEAGGGIVMNWTGNLTIGGTPQPVGGIILVRPSPKQILFLLIAATQTGSNQVAGAVSALAPSLQAL